MERSNPSDPGKPRIPEKTRTPSGLQLPHERDESADRGKAAEEPQDVMVQAEQDLAEGQEDTDCRGPDRPNKSHCGKD